MINRVLLEVISFRSLPAHRHEGGDLHICARGMDKSAPLVHDVGVDAVRERHAGHRRTGLGTPDPQPGLHRFGPAPPLKQRRNRLHGQKQPAL